MEQLARELELLRVCPRMEFYHDPHQDSKHKNRGKKKEKTNNVSHVEDPIDILSVLIKKERASEPARNIRTKKNINDLFASGDVAREGYKIGALPTQKSLIRQRPIMKHGYIPSHPSSVIFNGKSGSGKTNLLITLLIDPRFYGSKGQIACYFDKIYLFSPTAGKCDDLAEHLFDYTPLKEEDLYYSLDEAKLNELIEEQKAVIDRKGIANSPKMLIILDDVQSSQSFLKSDVILDLFLKNRHYNISTWLCSQSYTKTPRACRLQANNIFYFRGSASESDLIIDEYSPGGMRKKDFEKILNEQVFLEPYDFLHYNMRRQKKYSRNIDDVLEIV